MAVLLVMGAVQSSTAYEIKPKQPNHERLTALAERCLTAAAGALPSHCPLPRTAAEFAATDIGGSVYADAVRWPDDPTRQISATGLGKIAVNLGAERCKKHVGPGKPFGGLMCNSHYGALQFLHAMRPTAGEAPSETRAKILGWTRAAFAIATWAGALMRRRDIAPISEANLRRLRRHLRRPAFPIATTGPKAGKAIRRWRVHTLFTLECRNPFASTKCSELTGDVAADLARKRAAGALLHLIQDSFSQSHTGAGAAFFPPAPTAPASCACRCANIMIMPRIAGVHPGGRQGARPSTLPAAPTGRWPIRSPRRRRMLWVDRAARESRCGGQADGGGGSGRARPDARRRAHTLRQSARRILKTGYGRFRRRHSDAGHGLARGAARVRLERAIPRPCPQISAGRPLPN